MIIRYVRVNRLSVSEAGGSRAEDAILSGNDKAGSDQEGEHQRDSVCLIFLEDKTREVRLK